MSVSVVLLIVASALAHATWNALLKRSADPEHGITAMMLIGSVISVAVAFAWGGPVPSFSSVGWCLFAGALEAGYFVTLARALSRAPFGSVYTIVRGGALVIVWPFSVLLFDERLSLGRAAGTLLVLLGLAATGAGERGVKAGTTPSDAEGPSRQAPLRSGLVIAAFCALFVGGYQLAYKKSLSIGASPESVNAMSLSAGSMLNFAIVGGRRRRRIGEALKREPGRLLVGGALGSVGFLLFLVAMKSSGAGLVATLRNVSILFAQLLAFALGERPRRLGIVGAVLVVAGAVLLAM